MTSKAISWELSLSQVGWLLFFSFTQSTWVFSTDVVVVKVVAAAAPVVSFVFFVVVLVVVAFNKRGFCR